MDSFKILRTRRNALLVGLGVVILVVGVAITIHLVRIKWGEGSENRTAEVDKTPELDTQPIGNKELVGVGKVKVVPEELRNPHVELPVMTEDIESLVPVFESGIEDKDIGKHIETGKPSSQKGIDEDKVSPPSGEDSPEVPKETKPDLPQIPDEMKIETSGDLPVETEGIKTMGRVSESETKGKDSDIGMHSEEGRPPIEGEFFGKYKVSFSSDEESTEDHEETGLPQIPYEMIIETFGDDIPSPEPSLTREPLKLDDFFGTFGIFLKNFKDFILGGKIFHSKVERKIERFHIHFEKLVFKSSR